MQPLSHKLPFVTVIVPCRNEAKFIRACLESLLKNTYPSDRMELLVIDGESDDGTVDIVRTVQGEWPGRVQLIRNEKRILAAAWNLGITHGSGEIIMGLNAHGVFCPTYIQTCVTALEQTGVDYCGGIIRTHPRSHGIIARSIARVLSSPFGVGGSRFRTGVHEPVETDTAAFGGYRRSVFERFGTYDERLTRSQDFDFHLRMKAAGCRILLHPAMVCDYYVRTNLRRFLKDYVRNGYWVSYPLRYNHRFWSWRHLVPALCMGVGLLMFMLAFFLPPLWWVLAACVVAYVVANIVASAVEALRAREPWFLLTLPWLYALLHTTYAIGTLAGLIHAAIGRMYASR